MVNNGFLQVIFRIFCFLLQIQKLQHIGIPNVIGETSRLIIFDTGDNGRFVGRQSSAFSQQGHDRPAQLAGLPVVFQRFDLVKASAKGISNFD